MSAFVNTVDVVGDESLVDAIVRRTVTEIQDNLTRVVGSNAFHSSKQLKVAKLYAATIVDEYAFTWCESLEIADFAAVTQFGSSAFEWCSALTTLIIRTDSVATLKRSSTLLNTPIAKGTGYIYVPRALVDSYKTATNWYTYAAQFRAIEDYPEICDPYSWDVVAKTIAEGTYKDVYKVGDIVPLDLGSIGTVNMQIAAFDTDPLADGSGTAAISWVAKELLPNRHRMNPDGTANQIGTGTYGGWENAELRAYLMDTIRPQIAAAAAANIVAVAKTQEAYDAAGEKFSQTTTDEVWIPNEAEVKAAYAGLFSTADARVKCALGSTAPRQWWLRNCTSLSYFSYINTSGSFSGVGPTTSYWICLGFCTGRTPK